MQEQSASPATGRWQLACQARPWLQAWGREEFVARLPEVMATIAAIGYTGFETALACLPLDNPEAFAEAAARANGLTLCGAHAGGRWWAPEGAASIPDIAARASLLPALGCRRLVVSMAPLPANARDEELARLTGALSQLGRACREAAEVTVAFHNHAGELAGDARVIQAIVERCAPEDVMLGSDLGWVAHAGMDIAAFIQRFGARLDHLHVRDVTEYGAAGGFLEVGRGALDYRAILDALAAADYDGWLVTESEFTGEWRGETDPLQTAIFQYTGLRAVVAAAS